ncbi:unnamed protein product [Allacma fusca]|uniref:Uncharacterized protein n=1 Tax=Allacma fusca TaxID=39272 RepID=A0A8J2K3P0_9HEXA|nr:unnamed protein product [Allacma fusca]
MRLAALYICALVILVVTVDVINSRRRGHYKPENDPRNAKFKCLPAGAPCWHDWGCCTFLCAPGHLIGRCTEPFKPNGTKPKP